MLKSFDHRFLWGAGTSAFQIEGSLENDFTDWENAGRFDTSDHTPRVGRAADHWNRWQDDFDLISDLGLNAYRFSLAWSRIEPEPGLYDQEAIDRYSRMIDNLLERGITPMLTLHHFTHPRWFHERSPWHEGRSIESFVRYVERIAPELLDRVPLVVTLNEPLVWALGGYGEARFPPGERDLDLMMLSLHHMLGAHREAYDIIKHHNPAGQVGIAHNFIVFKRAPHGLAIDRNIKRLIHHFYNRMIIEAFESDRLRVWFPLVLTYDEPIQLDNAIDFWGINYYSRLHVRFKLNFERPFDLSYIARSSGEGINDLGWEIYPRGLHKVVRWVGETGKPMYITENGIAVADDSRRLAFLESHLQALEEIVRDGYDIRGYFHWSLLDNYEWLEGTRARFGLVHVDYKNYARTVKPSGQFYRDFISRINQTTTAKKT